MARQPADFLAGPGVAILRHYLLFAALVLTGQRRWVFLPMAAVNLASATVPAAGLYMAGYALLWFWITRLNA
jgi:hypothetical protein